MLVAVLGSPHGSASELTAFRHGWYAISADGLAAAIAAVLLRRRPSSSATAEAAATMAAAAAASDSPS
jgi:hypothetical protein